MLTDRQTKTAKTQPLPKVTEEKCVCAKDMKISLFHLEAVKHLNGQIYKNSYGKLKAETPVQYEQ